MRFGGGVLFDRCVRLAIALAGARHEDESRSAIVSALRLEIR